MGAGKLYLARQPILDRQGRMYAYELLFRGSRENSATITDDLLASAEVLHHVFAELGVDKALGPYRGFLNCDERLLLMKGVLDELPRQKMVLELLETVEPTPRVIERCKELKHAGFMLALDDFAGASARYTDLLPVVDIVKVDLLLAPAATLPALVADLAPYKLRLLAEKVDRPDQADHCRDLGFALFQGYYFAKPTLMEGRRLGQAKASLLRILALLLREAEVLELERIFKQEPGLAMNLLKLVNSVGSGQRNAVTSLKQALMVLGQRQLQRWLQLLLYTDPVRGEVANPLLQLAAARGRLMELLAQELWPADAEAPDRAFMAGIMSLMPALLGVPMAEILESLPIAETLRNALLHHVGPLGELLVFMDALDTEGAGPVAYPADLDPDRFSHCLVEAMAWANGLGQT